MKVLMLIILIIYLPSIMWGCSPSAIRVTEEVIKDVAEEEIKQGESK